MKININGKEYNFEVNGTVGLVYLAQRLLGDETFDGQNNYHQVVLYYAAFHNSNKQEKNIPDLQQFLSCMTTKTMTEMTEYFWHRWNELEGIDTTKETTEEEKQGED